MFRRYFLWMGLLMGIVISVAGQPQRPAEWYSDSLKQGLANAQTPADRVRFLLDLGLVSSLDPVQAEQYMIKAVEVAEMSRDRRLMARVYLVRGRKFLNNAGLSDNLEQGIANFHRSEEIARSGNLELLLVESYTALATAWRLKGDFQKALSYSNQSISIAGSAENDTARVEAYMSMGQSYLAMDEKLLSFRNFLDGLAIAEEGGKESLLKTAYSNLEDFYSGIKQYGKAIDYRMKMYELDKKAGSIPDMIVDDYNMGDHYGDNKQQDLALKMYENAISLADSMHLDLLKWDPYFRIFNMYMNSNQFVKGLTYLKAHEQVLSFLQKVGYQYFIDEIYGMSYGEEGRFDSADYYFRKAEPEVEAKANPSGRYDFYTAFGDYYLKRKNYPQALVYYQKAYQAGDAVKKLEWQEKSALQLDSIYSLTGDYRSARFYNIRYHLFNDSIRDLSREADLVNLETESDNQRRERLAREEETRIERRHNVQYLGFTIGLVVLFILLVMLGWFAVPAGFIRALGFVSFIFLFEFIILLADKSIQRWTHEEPWKVLAIKIALAAILVPLHHWLEHKVIHYLSHRKRLAKEKEVHVRVS